MDWHSIVHRIKSGDHGEIERVYTEYRQEFFRWMTNHYKCPLDEVQEIYQMSIIAFYENIVNDKITHLSSGIKTYLFAIGKHKFFELRRDKSNLNIELDEGMQFEVEDNGVQTQGEMLRITELERSLQQLGDPCKSILKLYYYHKRSMQDIAEKMGLKNADTAKNMKYKCLQRLKSAYNNTLA